MNSDRKANQPKSIYNLKKIVFILFVFCLFPLSIFGQEIDIAPYIKAWKTKDKTQTRRFENTKAFFTGVNPREIPFSEKHLQVVGAGKKYLQKNPDERIAIRLLMYEIWVSIKSKNKVDEEIKERFFEAIPIAYQLNDQQLLSEMFILYARFNRSSPEYIIYNTKALRIQEEIGSEYFQGYCAMLFRLCSALYDANNFAESIIYGEKYIACRGVPQRKEEAEGYIYVLDIMGANHFKLKAYDEAYEYYQKLLDVLENGNNYNERFHARWQGITKSSIGSILFEQGKTEESTPYLQSALKIALEENIWNTAASSQNILAETDYSNGDYKTALKKWKEAYSWVLKSKMARKEYLLQLKYRISDNISKAYYKLNHIDSTFYYLKKARQEQLLYEKGVNERNFDLITTNLNFEEATHKLEGSRQRLENERTLRNGILAGVILLGIISLLIIRQRQLQVKYRHRILMQEKEAAEQRASEARKNIAVFKKNIAEKEQLIEALRHSVQSSAEDLNEKFSTYVLLTEEEWLRFKDEFSRAYPMFLAEFRKILDSPTPAEERLCCLISLNLSNAQIAAMLGIGTDSVARSKRRLKNRITLPEDVSLEEYICKLHIL